MVQPGQKCCFLLFCVFEVISRLSSSHTKPLAKRIGSRKKRRLLFKLQAIVVHQWVRTRAISLKPVSLLRASSLHTLTGMVTLLLCVHRARLDFFLRKTAILRLAVLTTAVPVCALNISCVLVIVSCHSFLFVWRGAMLPRRSPVEHTCVVSCSLQLNVAVGASPYQQSFLLLSFLRRCSPSPVCQLTHKEKQTIKRSVTSDNLSRIHYS